MPRTVVVTSAGAILVLDPPRAAAGTVILPEGTDARAVELSDAEAAKFTQAGSYTVNLDGVVTVTPPTQATLDAQAAETTSRDERAASTTDLRTTASAAMTRLDAIITNGGTYTAVQVRDAVVDLARMQRRIIRRLVANG